MEPKNMKECDKRQSHINSKLHVICISFDNVRHPVTKTFTPLQFTTLHPTTLLSNSLHLSTLHFLSFKLHPTTLHSTSLHMSYTLLSLI